MKSDLSARMSGFSLIESLIALTLFLVIFLAGIEIFGSARKALFKIEEAETIEENIAAAVDRIRADIRSAGRGLAGPAGVETVKSLEASGDALVVRCGERETILTSDAAAGQRILPVADVLDFPAGRTVCVMDGFKGEAALVAAVETGRLILASPLSGAYVRAGSRIVLVRTISLYMDAGRTVLRRKVDAGAGQPLLEEARSFVFSLGAASPVVSIAVQSRLGRGDTHETSIHARNAALAVRR